MPSPREKYSATKGMKRKKTEKDDIHSSLNILFIIGNMNARALNEPVELCVEIC
jgi:hypothetical protein